MRAGLDRLTGGGYTRIHSKSNYSKTLDPIQIAMWWRNPFKWVRSII